MKKHFEFKVGQSDLKVAVDFLASKMDGFSKSSIKKLMNNGAVWRTSQKQKKNARLRKAQGALQVHDQLDVYYDSHLMELDLPEIELIAEEKDWGVFFKPAGVLAQGTLYGDHMSLLRYVEKIKGESFLVHRLDREASGLMVVAYSKQGAAFLSTLWQQEKVKKTYMIEVRGDLSATTEKQGELNTPLDGKKAITLFEFLSYNAEKDTSLVKVNLLTGRLHQIRRHFASIKHPVMGDPEYGENNKNKEGLKLIATALEFLDPKTRKQYSYELPKEKISLFDESSKN